MYPGQPFSEKFMLAGIPLHILAASQNRAAYIKSPLQDPELKQVALVVSCFVITLRVFTEVAFGGRLVNHIFLKQKLFDTH